MCPTPAIEQDEVVEHNLDAHMALAGRGIVPAQGMEPAGDVDAAAFVQRLFKKLPQPVDVESVLERITCMMFSKLWIRLQEEDERYVLDCTNVP